MRAEGRARLARDPDARSHCPNYLPTLAAPLRCPSTTLPHIRRSSCFRRPNRQMLPSPLGEGVVVVRSAGGMEVVVLHAADAAQARSVAHGPQREQMVAPPARATPMARQEGMWWTPYQKLVDIP